MSSSPKVRLRDPDPLQHYYQDCDGARWSVARLLDDTKDLDVFDLPLAGLDLSQAIWPNASMAKLADHVKQCMDADLSYPILLDWNGAIADGRHRILRAIADGHETIKARRMHWKPEPDRPAPSI